MLKDLLVQIIGRVEKLRIDHHRAVAGGHHQHATAVAENHRALAAYLLRIERSLPPQQRAPGPPRSGACGGHGPQGQTEVSASNHQVILPVGVA